MDAHSVARPDGRAGPLPTLRLPGPPLRMTWRLWAALLVATAACGSPGGTAGGDAIAPVDAGVSMGRPLPVGEEFAIQYGDLGNRSGRPITLLDLRMLGAGVGTTVRVLRIRVAPFYGGHSDLNAGDGVYTTYPPVDLSPVTGRCDRQRLVPIRGFVISPNRLARASLLLRIMRPGTLRSTGYLVRYRQGGTVYQQVVRWSLDLTARRNAKPIPFAYAEARCARPGDRLPA